jgi:hypothetical protein
MAEGVMRVGFIAWIAALARRIPLLMALGMPGLAWAQGTAGAPPRAPGLGPEDCYCRGTTADVIISACTAQLEKDPADAAAPVKRGMALSERGDFGRARTDLDAAIAIYTKADDYKLGDAYAARGAQFVAQRDFPKAIADYTKAIERQPDEPLRYPDRARALLASGDAKAALPDAERARSDFYGFAYPLLLRARIYLALGRRDEAVDVGPPPEDNDVSKEIRQRMGARPGGDYTQGAAERELAQLGVALALPPEPGHVAAPLPRGPCKAGQAPEEAAFAPTTLSIEPMALRVGQPIRIRWTTPAARRDAVRPTYLISPRPPPCALRAGSSRWGLVPRVRRVSASAARPCVPSCRCTRHSPRRAG